MKQSMSKPVYLMQADPSEICFLDEVLYWAAFQRLPQPFPNIDGNDFRSSSMPGYEVNCAYGGFADDECDRVGLPHDPRNSFDWAYFVTLDDDLETILSKAEENFDKADHDENSWRAVAHSEAMRLHHELEGWKPKYKKATELAKARVYVALKEGRLTAKGVLLPEMDEKKALESLAKEGRTFEDLMDVEIPREFWSFDYILWELSAARNDGAHYCQIHCETEQVLSCFPHDSLLSGLPVQGLERFGSFFVLNDCATMGEQFGRCLEGQCALVAGRRSIHGMLFIWN